MTRNYSAWDIRIPDFFGLTKKQDRLFFLVRFAVLAPSSHNSQPWQFKISRDCIEIHPDFNRALPDSDANNRQLYTSLGCALTNLLIAAEFYQLETAVTYPQQDGNTCIKVRIKEKRMATFNQKDHLIHYIAPRVTNRTKYTYAPLPQAFKEQISLLTDEHLAHYLVEDEEKKASLTQAVMEATAEAMASSSFRRELSAYVKPNTTKEAVGMPAFGMGIPTPVSYLAPKIIRYFNVDKLSHKTEEALLKQFTPYMGVICTKEDNPAEWIKSGTVYQTIALMAQREGLATHPLAAAIQIGSHYKKIQETFNTEKRPQFFYRIGKATGKTAHSPRLRAEELISYV